MNTTIITIMITSKDIITTIHMNITAMNRREAEKTET